MNQKDKELLLKDISSRLPYNVICFKSITNCHPGNSVLLEEDIYSLRTGRPTIPDFGQHDYYRTVILELKPYLRPISSMTLEEEREYNLTKTLSITDYPTLESFDWLLAHHFDFRGLIEKGLALEAPEGMYNL